MGDHECGKPNCLSICAAGLKEMHQRQQDVAHGFADGIEAAAKMLDDEAEWTSREADRAVGWPSAVLRARSDRANGLATRIRALGAK